MIFNQRHALHSTLHRERLARARKKSIIGSLFFLAILAGVFLWFANAERFLITHIFISGAAELTNDITQQSEIFLGDSYGWFIPKNNIFLYPKTRLENYLLDHYPELQEVNVVREHNALTILATMRQKKYAWCAEEKADTEEQTNGDATRSCYMADEAGVIFAPLLLAEKNIFIFSGEIQTTPLRPGNSRRYPIGYAILPEVALQGFIGFRNILESKGIHAHSLFIRDVKDYVLSLENGLTVFLSSDSDWHRLYGNMEAAMEEGTITLDDFTGKGSRLEYVDLRFDDKIYFKFK